MSEIEYTINLEVRVRGPELPWNAVATKTAKLLKGQTFKVGARELRVSAAAVDTAEELEQDAEDK